MEFSEKAFGPGSRVNGILDHITKELIEVEENPNDLEEWIDLISLALDGAWRQGFSPIEIAFKLRNKLEKNINREWPDWRKADPNKAIEHLKS
ncbi:MAG: dATP/dGTP pyrophosphohydrolase domain-containing protein [Balneola sp.]